MKAWQRIATICLTGAAGVLWSLSTAGCRSGATSSSAWVRRPRVRETTSTGSGSQRFTKGDTAGIRVNGPGARWHQAEAIPVATIAGPSPEASFGAPTSIAATADGGVVIKDIGQDGHPVILKFDSAGEFIRRIGRWGAGPGEYSTSVQVFGSPDGRILTADMMNGASHWFSKEGEYQRSIRIPGGTAIAYPAERGVFVPRLIPGDRTVMLLDTLGHVVDSISLPADHQADHETLTLAALTEAVRIWPLPNGDAVVISSVRVGFALLKPGAQPLIVERPTEPAKYLDEEYQQLLIAQKMADPSVTVPRAKSPVDATFRYGGGPDLEGASGFRCERHRTKHITRGCCSSDCRTRPARKKPSRLSESRGPSRCSGSTGLT